MHRTTFLSITVQGALVAMMLASPALARSSTLQCRMTEFCVNDFDCQKMDMAVSFSREGPGGPSRQGTGKITLSGEDEVPAQYRVDANGVLTATVTPEPGGQKTLMRLIAQGDGLGVLTTFTPSSGLSTIQFGGCFVE